VVDLDRDRAVTTSFGASGTAPPPDTQSSPPETALVRKAKVKRGARKVRLSFVASGDSTGYQCALTRKGKRAEGKRGKKRKRTRPRFKPCTSPTTYKRLKPGGYVFHVRAFGPAGVDSTPARKRFRIKRKKRKI
jgi:hypothetical protein